MKLGENNHSNLKMRTTEFGKTVSKMKEYYTLTIIKFCLSKQNLVTDILHSR